MSTMNVGAKTVVGYFSDMSYAEAVIQDLERSGIAKDQISIVAGNESGKYKDYATREGTGGAGAGAGTGAAIGGGLGLIAGLAALAIPGIGPIIAGGAIATALTGVGIGAAAGGLIGGLTNMGVPHEDAESYAEGVKRGGVLVTVRADDDETAERAADIMDDHGAEDINQRAAEWKNSSSTTGNYTTGTAVPNPSTPDINANRMMDTGQKSTSTGSMAGMSKGTRSESMTGREQSIPVVEEHLKVGKRQVSRGGVRVFSHVTEKPVEETVNLREEHVKVDRHRVDRPATEADFGAFREGTIELTETSEEPVIQKEARVVEEVTLGKDVEQRQQTVRDTVRRTDVEVEKMGSGQSDDDAAYRRDFESRYPGRDRDYGQYMPAYSFGSKWANDPKYKGRNWSDVETTARKDWESSGARGKWEDFKGAIQHGWDRVRARV